MPDEAGGSVLDIDAIRAFAETSPAAIAVLAGPSYRVLYLNPAFGVMCGRDPDGLLCRPAAEAFPELAAGGHLAPLDQVRTTGQPYLATGRSLPLGRPGRVFDTESSPIRGRDGSLCGVLVQLRDVTEAQARLRKAEAAAAVLDAVFEHAPVGLAVAAEPGSRSIRVSRHGLGMAGQEPAELLAGLTPRRMAGWSIFHRDGETPARPEDLPLTRALRQGEAVSHQHWVLRGDDGAARRVQCTAAPVRDGAGRIAGGLLAWGEPLAQHGTSPPPMDARYRALVETGALAVWTATADGSLISIGGWAALTGQSPAEVIGWGWLDAVHPEDRPLVHDRWSRAIASGRVYEAEYRLRGPHGECRWTAARAAPLRDADGSIREWLGVNMDIDDRKQAERALRESEARFRILAETMPHLVWQTDPAGEPDYVNGRWFEVTGHDLAGLRGGGWLAVLHPEDRPALAAAWAKVLAEGGDFDADARILTRDGPYRWYRVKAAPVRSATGAIRHWVGTCTDVDQRRSAEAQLREALAARELLAREADHRIKNSLQLVAALLRLQAGRVTEPAAREALEAATAREQAVAEAHRALQLSPDFRSIRLSDMLRELATGAASQHPAADIRIDAEDGLTLDAERAIPLALILSELVANALRHAYPRGATGPVYLAARLENGVILAEVRDAGSGVPAGAAVSLGETVIRSLAKQISAVITSEANPGGGTRVTLRLALESEAPRPNTPR